MTKDELQSEILTNIPISAAMGVRVVQIEGDSIRLAAPLAPNTNHKSTAFGGSIHALGVLACWALVTNRLQGRSVGYIVIQDSHIEYLKPVTGDFEAHATWGSQGDAKRFLLALDRKGLARVRVKAEIHTGGFLCAVLVGTFVAEVARPESF